MARTQAENYQKRRLEISNRAAAEFARRGFHGTSVADLAKACGTSKSLLYHYYLSKDEILFDVMNGHISALSSAAAEVIEHEGDPSRRLRLLTARFVELYVDAAAHQRVLINELSQLSPLQRRQIVTAERRLLDIVDGIILELRPDLVKRSSFRRPIVMLYFGMINWMHTWLDPSGKAHPAKIAELVVNTFLDGIRKADISA